MKKDNEARMKEILNELEDDFLDEEVVEEVVEDKVEENVEEETTEEELEEKVEEETTKEEVEEPVEEEITEEEVEEPVEEEATEEVKETKKEKTKKEISDESPIRKIGFYLLAKLKKYKYVLILDLVVFILLFFLIPTFILKVEPVKWMTLFLIFTILPTVAFYFGNLFKKYQITLGIPFFYLCILAILDSCTIKDLYGITSHGALDKTPAWIDALLVTFIIVFFQYVGLTVIDLAKKTLKRVKK